MLSLLCVICFFFFFNDTATTEIYTLSLHDALPICEASLDLWLSATAGDTDVQVTVSEVRRSEEHTSELQSPCNLVCRLLLEKKKTMNYNTANWTAFDVERDSLVELLCVWYRPYGIK